MMLGIKVVVSELAYRETRHATVEPIPIPKRRRRWRVAITTVREPQCYALDGSTMVVAPELYEKLKAAGANQ